MNGKLYVSREGEFTYPIFFENDFSALSAGVEEAGLSGRTFCIVTDSNVGPLYLSLAARELMKTARRVIYYTIPAGEANKTLETAAAICRYLMQEELDRTAVLAALGGGVVGDITGFAASIYLRGIDFIQIPTSLLAQVDSSVGGKTGVDLDQYKNMVGAFHQPRLVYMNMKTLETLPEEEFTCGMGEIVKTGLICDAAFFRQVCREQEALRACDPELLSCAVRRCCEIKAEIVERDPKEKGERALLNLGHTIGHAVEKQKNFLLRHGQCVGIGLIAAAFLSLRRGLLTQQEYLEIREGVKSCGLPVMTDGLKAEEVLAATRNDKKMKQGHIRFILLDGLGKAEICDDISDEELLAGIRLILERE